MNEPAYKIKVFQDPELDRQIEQFVHIMNNMFTAAPVYANNTAALAGGLTAGQIYRTATGALMVTYDP